MAKRGYGEGSIRCHTVRRVNKAGETVEYDYWRAVLPGGALGRRRYFQSRSEKAARTWLREQLGQPRGVPVSGRTGVTLGAYSLDWLADRRAIVSARTGDHYNSMLRYAGPIADVPIAAVTTTHIRDLVTEAVERGLSSRTVRGFLQTLVLVLKQAEGDGLVPRNVAALVRPPRLQTRPPRYFTTEQAKRLVEYARTDPMWGSFYVAALGTALRRNELLALTWNDVDLKARTLRVDRSKTAAGIRKIPLSPMVVEILRTQPRTPGRIWTFHESSVSHDFKAFCRRAGVPEINLHGLRHTAMTIMAEAGVPIEVRRWIAGHSKTEMTARYSHESETLMREAVEKLGELVG